MPFKDAKKKKEYMRKYYQIHKEQLDKVNRPRAIKWAKDNPTRIKEIGANYYETHREQRLKQNATYHKKTSRSL